VRVNDALERCAVGAGTAGLILLDKPSGPTSHDMVLAVRRGAREKRVGHAGTLDPLATGLLIICLGAATRLSEYLAGADKRYLARVRLGQSTDTFDADGEVTAQSDRIPVRAAVEAALAGFRGPLLQRPPAFSAIKRAGKKAYDLARRGEAVELPPRPVEVFSLELVEWQPPDCVLDVRCSSGMYLRSLAHDLGQALGCGAHLAALRRTASGRFRVAEAVTLDRLQSSFEGGDWRRYLRPAAEAVADWPEVGLTAEQAALIQHGRTIPLEVYAADWARAYNPAGEFIAVLKADARAGTWRPHKVLIPPATDSNPKL
jgi:tRNA pseudouridine55 synthase